MLPSLLAQGYWNNRALYQRALQDAGTTPHWDLCVLTAGSADQAEAYEIQVKERLTMGLLPPDTRFLVVSDPERGRMGSGGATLHALLRALETLEPDWVPGKDPVGEACRIFRKRRILIIHSGGDSKRVPHCSAVGKVFARVPNELPDGRVSTLFDEFFVSMCGLPFRMHEGVVVASGDVLLIFDHTQLDFGREGVVGASISVPAEVGTGHGVFIKDRDTGRVRRFLHKPSQPRMEREGAVDGQGRVEVDTGIVWMDPTVAGRWIGFIGAGSSRMPNEWIAFSLYGDFLAALPTEADHDAYLTDESDGPATVGLLSLRERIWERFHREPFYVQGLRPARFVHFGSTREYRDTIHSVKGEYQALGWTSHTMCSIRPECPMPDVALLNSRVSGKDIRLGSGTVVEDSFLEAPFVSGRGCVVVRMQHTTGKARLNSDLVLDQVPVKEKGPRSKVQGPRSKAKSRRGKEEGVVVRLYGVYDNPKTVVTDPSATFLNRPWREWLDAAGVSAEILWRDLPEGDRTLWNAQLYPVVPDRSEGLRHVLWMQRPEEVQPEEKETWIRARRMSLEESYRAADLVRVLTERRDLEETIRAERFLDALREEHSAKTAAEALGQHPEMRRRAIHRSVSLVEREEDVLFRMRVLESLSDVLRGIGDVEAAGHLEDRAFGILAELIRAHTAPVVLKAPRDSRAVRSVTVRAAARIDFGGGWSDTPPHSVERGGCVLNAAVELRGQPPIRAEAAFVPSGGYLLESVDLGVRAKVDIPEDLGDYADPSDPLALHKAALVLCGSQLGRGLRLTTEILIPKGSGLGTSSIAAGAVLMCLNRLIGREPSQDELFHQVLYLEQMLTTGGGWQDQVGGLVEGIKLIRTEPGLPQVPRWESVSLTEGLRRLLDERLMLVYTGQRRLAKGILREIMKRYIHRDPTVVRILGEIQELAVGMRDALIAEDLDRLGRLMREHWTLNKTLDPESTNPFLDELFERFEPYVVGGKLAGAGGGGFAMVVAKDKDAAGELEQMLERTYPDTEVRVWPCRIMEEGLASCTDFRLSPEAEPSG